MISGKFGRIGRNWSDSVGFCRIRSDLVGFGQSGRIWSDLVGFGRSSFWEGTYSDTNLEDMYELNIAGLASTDIYLNIVDLLILSRDGEENDLITHLLPDLLDVDSYRSERVDTQNRDHDNCLHK